MIQIRSITPAEAETLSAMSDSVGWNIAPEECRFLAEDPHAGAVFVEVDGEIAGSAGMAVYDPEKLVFINMVIVKPEFRRRGLATSMIQHIVKQYPDCKTFKLHATPDGSKVYAPLGFQMRRTISFFALEAPQSIFDPALAVHRMTPDDLEHAILKDASNFGFSRRNVLEFSYRQHPELALASDDGKGFLFGRRWKKYRQISAMTSPDPATAKALLKAAVSIDCSMPISIVVYDIQQDFQQFLLDSGFRKVREMFDMELGKAGVTPDESYRSIYGGDLG